MVINSIENAEGMAGFVEVGPPFLDVEHLQKIREARSVISEVMDILLVCTSATGSACRSRYVLQR